MYTKLYPTPGDPFAIRVSTAQVMAETRGVRIDQRAVIDDGEPKGGVATRGRAGRGAEQKGAVPEILQSMDEDAADHDDTGNLAYASDTIA